MQDMIMLQEGGHAVEKGRGSGRMRRSGMESLVRKYCALCDSSRLNEGTGITSARAGMSKPTFETS